MKGRWFRKYESSMDDPKVQLLSDWHYRAWDVLLCFASKCGGEFTDAIATLCFVLRKPEGKVRDTMQVLLSAGLMEKTETGYKPHNWDVFQYKSDFSNERVAAFRKRNMAVTCNVTETVNVTPPETEQIQSRAEQKDSRALARTRFQEFWLACPKKVGKGKAEKLFAKACMATSPGLLIASMASYGACQVGKDPEFILHPATWLSQRRWEDEGVSAAPASAEVISIRNAFQSPEELEGQRRMMEKVHGKATN